MRKQVRRARQDANAVEKSARQNTRQTQSLPPSMFGFQDFEKRNSRDVSDLVLKYFHRRRRGNVRGNKILRIVTVNDLLRVKILLKSPDLRGQAIGLAARR